MATPGEAGFELPVVQPRNGGGARPRWIDLDGARADARATTPMTVGGADVLVANVGGTLLAYRNACGWCGAARRRAHDAGRHAHAARRASAASSCRAPAARPTTSALQIAPVPLLRGEGRVRVAVADGGPPALVAGLRRSCAGRRAPPRPRADGRAASCAR